MWHIPYKINVNQIEQEYDIKFCFFLCKLLNFSLLSSVSHQNRLIMYNLFTWWYFSITSTYMCATETTL